MDKEGISSIKVVISGVIIGYIAATIMFVIYGIILGSTSISEETIPMIVKVILAVTIFISGLMSAHWIHNRGWLYGTMAGLIYIIVLLVLSAVFVKGFQVSLNTFAYVAIAILIGALGGILGINI